MQKFYRQGDVLIARTSAHKHGEQVPRDGGRVVLAYGEMTGHAHAITDDGAELYERDAALGERFLRVLAEGGVQLLHEEHATLTLPKGDYIVRGQREYAPYGERRVAD